MSAFATKFWQFQFTMLVQSGILVGCLLLIDWVVRKRVRAVVRYGLWLLVLVKLMLPTTLHSPTGVANWVPVVPTVALPAPPERVMPSEPFDAPFVAADRQAVERAETHVAAPPAAVPPVAPAAPVAQPMPEEPLPVVALAPPVGAPESPSQNAGVPFSWQCWLLAGWWVVVCLLVFLLVRRYRQVRELVAGSVLVEEGEALEQLDTCRAAMGLRRPVELRTTKELMSPAVCGLWRPVVLVPTELVEGLAADRLRVVFTHELCHLKRGDLWVNLVQSLLLIAYFFNPFLWLANARIRSLREKAVDEMALSLLDGDAKRYSTALVDVAELAYSRPRLCPRLIGVVESRHALGDRIRHILSRSFPRSARLGALGVVAIVVAAVALLPMWGNGIGGPDPLPATYEGAKRSHDYSVKVGPSTFRVTTVARYGRDGTAVVRAPDGTELPAPPSLPAFPGVAAWMDIATVQWEPAPDSYDPIEVRVFDHASRREARAAECPNFGCSLDGSSLTVYSIGRHLPDSLDIWLRVAHRESGPPVLSIKPLVGEVGGGDGGPRLRIAEISKKSLRAYDHSLEPVLYRCEWDAMTTVTFATAGMEGRHYQVCAVGRDGRRVFPESLDHLGEAQGHPMDFAIAMADIDHFELRPHLGGDKLVFEDVRLPVRSAALDRPPVIRFDIDGKPGTYVNRTVPFAPLRLLVEENTHLLWGGNVKGSYGTTPIEGPRTALVLQSNGLFLSLPQIVAYDRAGQKLPAMQHAWSAEWVLFAREYARRTADIAAVELRLDREYFAFRPRFVGIAAVADDTLYSKDGQPIGMCPYLAPGDNANHRLVFDFPITDHPIQFVPPWFVDPCGPEPVYAVAAPASFSTVDVLEGRQRLVLNADLPLEYQAKRRLGLGRKTVPLDRFDYTLCYCYGPPGEFLFRFPGPLKVGVPVPAEDGKPCTLLVTQPQEASRGHESQLHFQVSGPAALVRDTPLAYCSQAGERVVLTGPSSSGWRKAGANGDVASVEFDLFDTDLSEIGSLGAEALRELTIKGIRPHFPAEDAPRHKLGTETLSAFAETLSMVPSEAPRTTYSKEALADIRKLAMEFASSPSAYQRLIGIQAGLSRKWPEFVDMALDVIDGTRPEAFGYTLEDGRMANHANVKEMGTVSKLAIIEGMSRCAPLNRQQLQKVESAILATDDPLLLSELFRVFWKADALATIEVCKELAEDDRPWIWRRAIKVWKRREAGAAREGLIERTDIRDYPRPMQLRLALAVFDGVDVATYQAANRMAADLIGTELLYRGGDFHDLWWRIVRELGREEATAVAIRFLQEVTDPAVQKRFFRDYCSRDYSGTLVHATMQIVGQVSLWYGLDLNGLGEDQLKLYAERMHTDNRPRRASELLPYVNAILQWRRENPDAKPMPLAIRGRVVDPDGNGIGRARVTVQHSRRTSPFGYTSAEPHVLDCAPDGSFVFGSPQERDMYELVVEADGYETKDHVMVPFGVVGSYEIGTNNTIKLVPK